MFNVLSKNVENLSIDPTEEIGVEEKYYFRKLSYLLDETPNRVIGNFLYRYSIDDLFYSSTIYCKLLRFM